VKRIVSAMLGGLLLASPLAASADSLGYNYWQAAYVVVSPDDFPDNLDGWAIGGSMEISDRFFVTASYADVSDTYEGVELSEEDTSLAFGYAHPLTPNYDLVGRVGWVRARAEIQDFINVRDDGYSLAAGVRGRPLDALEFEAAVQYVDLSDFGDSTSVGLGVFWYFVPQVALAASGSINEDGEAYSIGLRGSWGRRETRTH
jgi:Outer membrane protein beta-barrel domain